MNDSSCDADFRLGVSKRHKKKAEKRPPEKIDHKHTWEPVIFSYIQKEAKYCYFAGRMQWIGAIRFLSGKRCPICGKLDYGFPGDANAFPVDIESSYIDINTHTPTVFYQLNPAYHNLPIVRLESLYPLKKEVFL